MKKSFFSKLLFGMAFVCVSRSVRAQENTPVSISPFVAEGVVVVGYADEGAYVNFMGPGIRLNRHRFSALVGVLPSIRIKEDSTPKSAPRNSIFTPSLGLGLTVLYKRVAVQIPLYYTSKTAVADGKWSVGVGLGFRFIGSRSR